MAVILAFGDSITYGSWSSASTNWCSLLRAQMDTKFDGDYRSYGRVYNLGIGGETTDDALKRFLPETQARLRDEEKVIFIIAYGANDACFLPSQQKFRVTAQQFEMNLQQMITEAKAISNKIILLNIIPLVESANVSSDQVRLNKYYEHYNLQLAKVAQDSSITLIDVNEAFRKTDYVKILGKDGLHPNELGHKLLFELISPVVDKLLGT